MSKPSELPYHTIVLLQLSSNKNSRTFMEYETVAEAMDGLCQLYEQSLKALKPDLKSLSYDIRDLYEHYDNTAELVVMVYNPDTNTYSAKTKSWVKSMIFNHLKQQMVV